MTLLISFVSKHSNFKCCGNVVKIKRDLLKSVCARMHACVHMHAYMHVRICVCACACVHVHVCMCMCAPAMCACACVHLLWESSVFPNVTIQSINTMVNRVKLQHSSQDLVLC